MEYPDLDRIAHRMAARQTPVVPLDRLASPDHRTSPHALERALRADRRFRIIEAGPDVPGSDEWHPAARAAYERAFRRAGLSPERLVVLVERPEVTASVAGSLAGLLRHTLSRLLVTDRDGHRAAETAPRFAALAEIMSCVEGTSTTPPPPAPAPAPGPRRPRPPARPPTRFPESRRG